MRQRVLVRSITAIGVGGAMALVGPALAAGAVGTAVEIGSTGRLLARGAAVTVPVKVTCEPNQDGPPEVFVRVTQARGRMVANGFGRGSVTCDGTTQRLNVLVTAETLTFKTGTAVATADFGSCGPFFPCQSSTDTRVIRISS